jgi:hypothetical protein
MKSVHSSPSSLSPAPFGSRPPESAIAPWPLMRCSHRRIS